MDSLRLAGPHRAAARQSEGRGARPARPKLGTTEPVVPTSRWFMVPMRVKKTVEDFP
jgi:hypothetical protein